ncbi:mreC protein [Lactobacillus selangorensis]|uniref:Cell shape-determining protein MreC n=1 Tax=Lactobacillus selangorensis TaxID=81857 RepID=A0A0R2G9U2_9LACO|nr:rod shape-determining protein MreC [Lactobacillus selangorensis]KRN29347.1 mreC protein [Lactobacillus selangorensis]KRN34124.1 mreC protein [Lactobacillus selangorensis]
MQKFFSNKKLIVLLIAVIVAISMIAVTLGVRNRRESPSLVQQFGNDMVGFADRVIAVPANGLQKGTESFSNLFNTYEENEKLKKQLDQLAQTKVTAQTLRTENKELKKQLKLNDTLTDYTQISAAVLSRSPDNWQNQVVINKGSVSGVAKNMPVMSGSGLIGRVVEVNKSNSKVELISTTNKNSDKFAAEVTTKDGKRVNGIISGYDANSKELIMSQLNTNKGIKKGDKVTTSGLGGRTPKGLFIGTVQTIKKDDYGLASSIYLKPATDLNNFTVVTVIHREMGGQ